MPTKPSHGWSILVTALAIYLLFASGYIDAVDASASIETARALVERGSLRATPDPVDYDYYARTPGVCCYSKMGWVHPVLYTPAIAGAKLLRRFDAGHRIEGFLVSLVNPILTTLVVWVLFLYFSRSHTPRTASLYAAAIGFSSFLFPYSKTTHREPLQALLLACAFHLGSSSLLQTSGARKAGLVGLVFLALATKTALIIPLIPLGILVWHMSAPASRRVWVGLAALSIGATLLISKLIFGSFISGGYGDWVIQFDQRIWSTPFLSGVHAQVFSIRSGFFAYTPCAILLLPVIAHKIKTRAFSSLDWALLTCFWSQVFLYAKWYSPLGSEALGPRYLVAVTPIAGMLLKGFDWQRLSRKAITAIAVTLFLSTSLQIINSSVKTQQYWTFQSRAAALIPLPHWLVNLKFFAHKLTRNDETYSLRSFGIQEDRQISLAGVTSLQGFNFWWAHWLRSK